MRYTCLISLCLLLVFTLRGFADGPKDNVPDNVRSVPPLGIELDAETNEFLTDELQKLQTKIAALRSRKHEIAAELLPDVEIFSRAVRDSLAHRELFAKGDIAKAKQVLATGHERADALSRGEAPWTTQTGLVVRGFRSRIDDTVQPYGLVIPDSYAFHGPVEHRLDLWFHGRGERSVETQFIFERMNKVGRYAPADTIVLHPFGRYSNAFKFAGEIDVLEALQHAKTQYRIDEDRISVRGFSMGGAGCWQMAVHYPGMFFAANPGAGFSETPEFLRTFQGETLQPTWYERKLWQMYDCTGYAGNLRNLPTIAYSGEIDRQKQAADMMEAALRQERIRLTHVIGPQTAHTIHPDSMEVIERKMDSLAEMGRDVLPRVVDFTTYSLRYNRSFWVTITGMKQHWEKARVIAALQQHGDGVLLQLEGINALHLEMPAGHCSFNPRYAAKIEILDGPRREVQKGEVVKQELYGPRPESDRSWSCDLYRENGQWKLGKKEPTGLRKRHGLQGPIDDAFMDRFVIVKPSGKANHAAVNAWSQSEMQRMIDQWRKQFRGDAIVRLDSEVTAEDIEHSNLILFGDPSSNQVIKDIVDKLPIEWSAEQLSIGDKTFDAAHHAPVMIYPNPQNPQRYVVLNSGFTYREYAYLNNARQVPKLPDWAVIDLRQPADALWPGKVVEAGFFDESWKLGDADY
ncbi:prolyl oligopeptidase family serine peptidase [Roseimaritima ulvae]|uniref:Prolyl oligopeptidase family protein n=1 Tax=Roseimaritima ulvae TaxID=980254 RepID=A0A5B9QRT4_9BACT|nr:prolyl oligopeptidase family serine peptidase [Roseimaritima ulvae]QEG41714.1 Prolyl oligopeptidase family protein [Roseimaritima ulvae]